MHTYSMNAPRQTTARYRDLIASARDANMNMLRLWGGGQFEHDDFYEICDELVDTDWLDPANANDPDFLVVPPGHAIGESYDGSIFCAEDPAREGE